jgi:hypothetical protein
MDEAGKIWIENVAWWDEFVREKMAEALIIKVICKKRPGTLIHPGNVD